MSPQLTIWVTPRRRTRLQAGLTAGDGRGEAAHRLEGQRSAPRRGLRRRAVPKPTAHAFYAAADILRRRRGQTRRPNHSPLGRLDPGLAHSPCRVAQGGPPLVAAQVHVGSMIPDVGVNAFAWHVPHLRNGRTYRSGKGSKRVTKMVRLGAASHPSEQIVGHPSHSSVRRMFLPETSSGLTTIVTRQGRRPKDGVYASWTFTGLRRELSKQRRRV